jgi:hypothetical protein
MKNKTIMRITGLVLAVSMMFSASALALTSSSYNPLNADMQFMNAYEQLILEIKSLIDWEASDDAIPIDDDSDDDFYFNVDALDYILSPMEAHELITNGRILGDGVPLNSYDMQGNNAQASQFMPMRWGSGNGNAHQHVIAQAFVILSNDKPSAYNFFLNWNAAPIIKQYSDWPDSNEIGLVFNGHFGNLNFVNYLGQSSPTTYTNFNSHYNAALTSYRNGNRTDAWRSLGKALHYIADASNYHHAVNKTVLNSDHGDYEEWVDARLSTSSFNWTSVGSSYYTAIAGASLDTIVYSATHNASQNSTSTMTYTAVTQATLTYAQAVTAAVLYKFWLEA